MTFIYQSSEIVKHGTNINITCVVSSIIPPDSAYLRVDNEHTSDEYIIGYWVKRKRICTSYDYSRRDCVIKTVFQYNTLISQNSSYSCGYEKAESKGYFVEVVSSGKRERVKMDLNS